MSNFDIVLDTNVLFSGLYSKKGASYRILRLIGKDVFTLHLSVPLVLEYEEKRKDKRRRLGLTISEINDIVDYLCSAGVRHESINLFWRPCLNDPDDEMVLALGVQSNSDFIITHNIKDFKNVKGLRIKAITPHEFLLVLGKEEK